MPEASFRMIGAWPQLKRATSKEFFRRTKALIVNEGMRDAAKDLIKSVRTVISKGKAGGPPLKPITVLLKGHALKLSATGRMANAFTAEKSGLLTWNVGIDSKAKYPDGTKVATVAGRHEFGANVPVTSAVRLELRNKGVRLRRGTSIIRIPARPYRVIATRNAKPGMASSMTIAVKKAVRFV